MLNKITVSEKRGLFPECSSLGTIGEKNATTLLFLLPASLQGYSENIVCVTSQGSFNYEVSNDTFDLPSEVLTDNTLKLQFVLKDGDKVIWKSIPYTFTLNPTLDDSGENVIEKAKSEQKETDRSELGETLSDLTGQDLKKADWDELIDVANELPLKSEQDVIDLTKCSELTYAFEHATTPPSLITGGYKLDKEDPDDTDSPDILIKLPFLETPNAVYTTNTRVSASVEECGFSIGEASANTICKNEKGMFGIFAGTVPQNLKKLTLAGVERIPDTAHMFHSCSSFEELYLIEGENFAEEYSDNYYAGKFMYCSNLQSILGTPLDMSRGNNYNVCFTGCKKLRYVYFKPYTICHNLSLSDCSQLTRSNMETIVSLLNGCRIWENAGTDSLTITLNSVCKDDLKNQKCHCNKETGEYISHSTYLQSLEEEQKNYGAEVDYITAFTHQGTAYGGTPEVWYKGKGVTLAWS